MTTNKFNNNQNMAESTVDNHVAVDAGLMVQSNSSCPVCACSIIDNETKVVCEHCSTPHHDDCWEYAGGCAIFGCRKDALRPPNSLCNIKQATIFTNLRIMTIWGWFVKIKWAFFEGMVSALICSLFLWSLSCIMFGVWPVDDGARFMVTSVISFLASGITMLVPLFGIAYVCTLPISLLMRFHFNYVSKELTDGNGRNAKSIADRVALPASQKKVDDIERYFIKSSNSLFIVLCAVGMYRIVILQFPYKTLLVASMLLILVRAIIIPMFKRSMKRKVLEISTFHNRLMASSKRIKDK